MGWAHLLAIAAVGAGVGFLSGLLGKGGSAVATPVLAALGVPPMAALATPLPATIPSTLAAARPYRDAGLVDRSVLRSSLVLGVPATVAGALLSAGVDGTALVRATDLVLVAIGARMLVHPSTSGADAPDRRDTRGRRAVVAIVVGLTAGLLASSGGFLLAPLYVAALHMPLKRGLGTSLAAASVLAVPGTVVHAWLGHIDWTVMAVFAAGSVPLAPLGARLALRTPPAKLERAFGAALVVLGAVFLVRA